MRILFVTWDGPQVNYLEGLFLPIFKALTKHGHRFHILQFTWGAADRMTAAKAQCIGAGILYRAVKVWRKPSSVGSFATAVFGAQHIRKAVREWRIDILMPRSTLPALASLLALRSISLPLIFDADGLPLDERVDFAGQSPLGLSHRFLREIEIQAVHRANVVLTRTSRAIDILHARAGAGTPLSKFHIVSNGRDAAHFKPCEQDLRTKIREGLGIEADAPLVVYAGSLGGKYCLSEMLRLFMFIQERRADARLIILTSATGAALSPLTEYQDLQSRIAVLGVPSEKVARYLSCADVGLSLIKSSFSMQAASAIKTGEYLLSGLPVIGTSGIGDSKRICSQSGIALEDLSTESLKCAADWFVDVVLPNREHYRMKSRKNGVDNYSIDSAVQSYVNAFSEIIK